MTWAVGWFGGGDPESGRTTTSFTRVIARVTGLPLYDPGEDDTRLVHVGLGFGYVFSFDGPVQFSSRPESFFAPRLVDTGKFDADSAWGGSLEAAAVHGPFSVQSEYLFIRPDAVNGGSLFFHGFYVMGSWFLTGENRRYDTSQGVFGRVVPKRSVGSEGGWGAFELAARFSYLDLDDGSVRGGKMTIPSAGFNWYLTKHVRTMFDYGFATADKSGEHSQVHIFQTRLQLDF